MIFVFPSAEFFGGRGVRQCGAGDGESERVGDQLPPEHGDPSHVREADCWSRRDVHHDGSLHPLSVHGLHGKEPHHLLS